jgi:hypothetical protein
MSLASIESSFLISRFWAILHEKRRSSAEVLSLIHRAKARRESARDAPRSPR